jgi:hypothetical protein
MRARSRNRVIALLIARALTRACRRDLFQRER